jgi:hypothetical protein
MLFSAWFCVPAPTGHLMVPGDVLAAARLAGSNLDLLPVYPA